MLQSITECCRVLQSITEYYRVLQSITEYYRVFLAHLLGPIFGLVQKGGGSNPCSKDFLSNLKTEKFMFWGIPLFSNITVLVAWQSYLVKKAAPCWMYEKEIWGHIVSMEIPQKRIFSMEIHAIKWDLSAWIYNEWGFLSLQSIDIWSTSSPFRICLQARTSFRLLLKLLVG